MATEQQQVEQQQQLNSSSSSNSSLANSISLVKLDELSSFGATKQNRLPALIRMEQVNSMPAYSGQQIESQPQQQQHHQDLHQASLPANLGGNSNLDKENTAAAEGSKQNEDEMILSASNTNNQQQPDDDSGDFQVLDMGSSELVGPSLPAQHQSKQQQQHQQEQLTRPALVASQQLNQQPQSTGLIGDSLIEMIINLRNENQNLVRVLETNNDYVKERINEFKRLSDESKRREAQFALEKADYEHQARKLQRQNLVLSERLKSMEAKLKDMKLEVSESLAAANSSKASSVNGNNQPPAGNSSLYPTLTEAESFANSALSELQQRDNQPTMQMEATDELEASKPMDTSMEQANDDDDDDQESDDEQTTKNKETTEAKRIGSMSKEELSKRFDADKAEFYALSEDPLKQCDKLEQQLNDVGKRDYEICLLQQQLNIYRQDYRLERMANLEAKIQIEKLRSDIDRLCYERLQERGRQAAAAAEATAGTSGGRGHHRRGFETATDVVIGKLGHQLGRRAAKTAAKAAKYAAKQAHREEKAQSIAAARAAAAAAAATPTDPQAGSEQQHHSRRHHHFGRHHRAGGSGGGGAVSGLRAVRSEVVSDLLSTANKAMLTGYKMASTHVNLALDKLSQFEQAQANNLAQNKNATTDGKPSAPPMGPPSID